MEQYNSFVINRQQTLSALDKEPMLKKWHFGKVAYWHSGIFDLLA